MKLKRSHHSFFLIIGASALTVLIASFILSSNLFHEAFEQKVSKVSIKESLPSILIREETDMQHICEPTQPCVWATEQMTALFNQDPQRVSSYVPSSELLQFQNSLLNQCMEQARTQQKWILFYEEPYFKGHIYILPAIKSSWIFEGSNSNSILNAFLGKFQFYYGRKFSVYVPKNYQIVFQGIEGGSYPGGPLIIKEGLHSHLQYFKGPLSSVSVVLRKPNT